jgi:hypothetical protein
MEILFDTPCAICSRTHIEVPVYKFAFGEKKEIIISGYQTKPNPNYLEIAICTSCRHRIGKIRKENPEFTSKQLLDAAIEYRSHRPVGEYKLKGYRNRNISSMDVMDILNRKRG